MKKYIDKLGIIGSAIGLTLMAFTSTAFAVQVNPVTTPASTAASQGVSNKPSTNPGLTTARLKVCQARENAINNIMSRINTRAQNQINLFNTIAQRVEGFYTSSKSTVSNYSQLVANISAASSQANSGLSTLSSNSNFTCSVAHPRSIVQAFQGYLKTEISNLQNLRTQVKDLIVAVAKANKVTITSQNNSAN